MPDDEGAPIHVLEDERAEAFLIFGSTTEPSPSPGAALLASEADSARARILDSVVRDISPHTRLLHQARLRVEEFATANRRKDEFLATLTHELRSPLAAIQYAVRLLSSQTGETPARQRTQALVERQVRRMTQLVADLLDVSRISHGRLHLQRERIDLSVVVSNAIETLESDINERHHRLTTTLPDAPVWLQADPWRLEQVFVNLLANACKYTDAGGELAVRVHTRDGQAVVRIQDSGMGIAPDALPHIFDLFRQADEAAPRTKSGLGIGLALVRNLVELHGGSVTATSAGIKQGSEFTVHLPREALKTIRQQAGAQADETKESRRTARRPPDGTGGEQEIHRNGEWSGQAGTPSVGLGSVRSVADPRQEESSTVMEERERDPLRRAPRPI